MNLWLILPVSVALGIALLSTRLLNRGIVQGTERYQSIDGLRGYLAFFVFMHHSCIWYFYLHEGQWAAPPFRLFRHFGNTSVALFFMITAFLFFSKLMNHAVKPVRWTGLFVSRAMRLTPLYLVALLLLLLLVAIESGFVLRVAPGKLVKSIGDWFFFTVNGSPDMNGVPYTSIMIAGVTWSLVYEWLFYLALPFFGLLFRIRAPFVTLLICGTLMTALIAVNRFQLFHLLFFAGGMVAALLVRFKKFCALTQGLRGSLMILVCVLLTVLFFDSPMQVWPLLLLSLSFSIIAAGNSFFGMLHASVSQKFGEMAYSIYLLHGLLLYTLFHFLIGTERAAALSITEYILAVCCLTPVLILTCTLCWRYIENPGINLGKRLGKK